MRYELIGPKIPNKGKTLWEIVSNLKNFGVGRLILKYDMLKYPELSFCKIVKVIPVPPPKKQFVERRVLVYVDEIYRGQKLEEPTKVGLTHIPNFMLIPKFEEEKYLEKAKEYEGYVRKIITPKYLEWPPLYKKLWENEQRKTGRVAKEIPKLKTVVTETVGCTIVLSEEVKHVPHINTLNQGDATVEEMIKEIVSLQKIINLKSPDEKNDV